MVGFLVLAICVLGFLTYLVVRISISCMFWASKNREDRKQVFKIYFPYYIIILFGLCITAIIGLGTNTFTLYYFGSVFFMSLFIWNRKIQKTSRFKKKSQETEELQNPNLL